MFPSEVHDLARAIISSYARRRWRIATAESCTGGLVAAALTQIPGASEVFERGFVTYSNEAKTEVLGVMLEILDNFGAVSSQTAEAMARGALAFSLADVAVSVTGIAGPSGAMPGKPVGLVYLGLATRAGVLFHERCEFRGDRDAVRAQAVAEALRLLEAQGESEG
ncbi:MAG: CinA family protein [Bdellovibrionales bacterium]